MTPSIGRIVHYILTEDDAVKINRRRTSGSHIAARMKTDPPQWPAGAQAHIGNYASTGEHLPMTIVKIWPNEFGDGIPGVNGQVLLDGNDALWVTSAREQAEDEANIPGTWHWPERVE